MAISRDMKRKFDLISALSKNIKPDLNELQDMTGIPAVTIKRQLCSLRDEFGMEILYIRTATSGGRGTAGYYTLADWGVINKEMFLARYAGQQVHENQSS
ncbi:MAG: helix-turn-helix domain-containing protein [Shewanella sp.]